MRAINTTSFYGSKRKLYEEKDHVEAQVVDFTNSDAEISDPEDEIDMVQTSGVEGDDSEYSFPDSESSVEDIDQDTSINDTSLSAPKQKKTAESKQNTTKPTEQNYRWRKRTPVQYDVAYCGEPFPDPEERDKTPLKYFKEFFDNELIELLVDQTNLYSMQCNDKSINVDCDEMEQYLGILITMSIVKLPQARMYWSHETRIPLVADVMSVNRFEKIRQFLHFNDNNTALEKDHPDHDKLFKVRPVIESVLSKCKEIPQEETHSIDEQIIPTKGRTGLRQYMPNKPNKWGIKVWARCGVSGLVYDFEIYTGRSNKVENYPELLMGGNVVHRLTRSLPSNVNHKIYFDNFFTSVHLMNSLRKDCLWAVGTIRKDRLKGA